MDRLRLSLASSYLFSTHSLTLCEPDALSSPSCAMLPAHSLPQHLCPHCSLCPPSQGNLPWTETKISLLGVCTAHRSHLSLTTHLLWFVMLHLCGYWIIMDLPTRSTKSKVMSFLHIAIVTPQSSIKGSGTVPHRTSRSNNYLLLEFPFADEEGKSQRD